MGHKLKTIEVDGGLFMSEKACENYICSSCGQKMISVNFVNGLCIQVFCSHGDNCTNFEGNAFTRTVEVACDTCKYYDKETIGCHFEGYIDKNIESCRTHM